MHNLSEVARAPQATDSPFAADVDPDQLAAEVSGEHDSIEQVVRPNGATFYRCANCGELEPADVDASYDGSHAVAWYPACFEKCAKCEDCRIHPKCGKSVDGQMGLCLHCHELETQAFNRRMEEENQLASAAWHTTSDLRHFVELLRKESDPEKRREVRDELKWIWETAISASVENHDWLQRQMMAPLPALAVSA